MSSALARATGLLRRLAIHLVRRPVPIGGLTQEMLHNEGIGYAREKINVVIAIRMPGHLAFPELTDCLLDHFPAMERGAVYSDIKTELLNYIEAYIGRDPATIGSGDSEALVAHFGKWHASRTSSRRVFVPCVISRVAAPRFEIGPITFEFIDRVASSDFCPPGGEEMAIDRFGFASLVQWMRDRDADWLARVAVDGCELKRAEEVAELAVDLAIVALQLAAPHLGTRTMGRLDTRRGTSRKRTLSESDGYHNSGWSLKEPGTAIGQGYLLHILETAAPIFTAVGNVVHSFASGSFRLPGLERAWCDAAYWLHEALAEPIDTIAIAKLETALEVLVRAESSAGSERRMMQVLGAFFGLGPNDPIGPGSTIYAKRFARNVVRDRSRILHGTLSTLGARGIDRAGMEGFVVTVIRAAVIELEAYAGSDHAADDVQTFLSWVQQRRMTPTNT